LKRRSRERRENAEESESVGDPSGGGENKQPLAYRDNPRHWPRPGFGRLGGGWLWSAQLPPLAAITRSCIDSILPGWPARAHCQYGLLRQNYTHKVWLHNISSTTD
jgi:hypothetical protein